MIRRALAVTAVLIAVFATRGPVRAADPPRLRARVVSDARAVRAGEAFTVGVLVEIPEGFHIYWKDSGGTGVPTTLELALPPGFSAGAVQYPLPTRFVDPTLTTIGYEGSVLLAALVTPPADLAGVASVTIDAKASWLCCDKDRCVPGQARVAFAAPVAARSERDAEGAALVESWRARLPGELGASALQVKKGLGAQAKKGRLEATVTLPEEGSKPELFAAAPAALDVLAVSARPDGRSVAVTLDVEVLESERLGAAPLEVVLAYETKGGERRGVRFALPLRQ